MAFFQLFTKTKIKAKKRLTLKLSIVILAFFVLSATNTQARTFNPHNIITDDELINKDSLSQTAIQKFLEREDSVLARYSQIINGQTIKASAMIWEIAQKHNISPKFLLTTLEKEQGLIHRDQATEKALDWATGYGCYGGGCKEKYRGFYNQVEATAETQQIYWQKAGQFSFTSGQTTNTFDGYKVTPANKATANLYIYTPYVGYAPELGVTQTAGGNKLFWRIWSRYFTNQKFLDGQTIAYNGSYWLIRNNQKNKYASAALFLKDHQATDAINVSSDDLAAYPDGPEIVFADNTLVKSADSGQIYLLAENQKRPIIDNAALALLENFQIAIAENEIPAVFEAQIADYALGTLISNSSVFPQGKLFKDETGKIWRVQDGLKHEVNPLVWQNRFGSAEPETISSSDLEKYPSGSPVKLKDGTFVTIDGKYYLISNGERMKVEDLAVFDRDFGLAKKEGALKVASALLEIHDASDYIDYIDDTVQDAIVSTDTSTPVSGNYAGSFDSISPDGLIMINGATQKATIKFKNSGNTNWQPGDVWLKITDKDKETSSFGAPDKINFTETSVASGQLASFTFDLTAPTSQTGLLNQEFSLYYDKNGTPTKITSVAKFIIVKAGLSAQIIEHNLPVAVKNTWKPIQITMKIKNTSADTTWLARKTALGIYNQDGSTSYFYDPNDWVRKEVAAVSVGKTYIKPGETGEFKFTLDPRGIKKGTYVLNFKLKLIDKDKEAYLNGQQTWTVKIRVD